MKNNKKSNLNKNLRIKQEGTPYYGIALKYEQNLNNTGKGKFHNSLKAFINFLARKKLEIIIRTMCICINFFVIT